MSDLPCVSAFGTASDLVLLCLSDSACGSAFETQYESGSVTQFVTVSEIQYALESGLQFDSVSGKPYALEFEILCESVSETPFEMVFD